jgi:multicomponent K+:H+ antiporter subunit A
MTDAPTSNLLLPTLALLPWLGALLTACLPAHARRGVALLSGGMALLACALVLALAPAVLSSGVPRWSVAWLPALGLDLGFRMDGLAWLFALLITGIGALVVLYAAWYLDPADPARRFFVFLQLFMGAMLGVVLADNLILLVLFWELTSLSSFLLIGYWHGRDDAREGARMALTITGAGGLCLLAGVLLIGHIVGSFSLDVVLAAGDQIRAHALYETALVLVLLGAFTKSAQFPFHFWLPHAMAAPTPVSSYLHSATMVKAGVFLLARLHPALGGSEPWFWIVSLTGLATLLLGAYVAIFKHDLKGLLAYSTISHLGLITLLFGLDEPLAVVAGVFHIINHATFKAGLFMSAGIIDHECGSRDMRKLGGLMKLMPFTATLGMVAAAAMAGVPLLNGFLSKEMFFAETVAKDTHMAMAILLPLGATLAGVFSVAYSLRFIHDTFFNGDPVGLPKTPHEAPFFMRLPVLLLVLLCVAVGLAPAWTVGPVLAVAAQAAVYGAPGPALPPYTLALWHGLNLPLAMSVVAVVGGALLYIGLQRFINLHRVVRLPGWIERGGREFFLALQTLGLQAAGALTGSLQNGHLQRYLALLVLMALAAGALPFLQGAGNAPAPLHLDGLSPGIALVGVIGIAATVGTVLAYRQRLLALVLIGAVGLVVCLVFVWFSAPDLALTQLLVEVVTVMLMLLSLRWLPQSSPVEGSRWRARRDAVIALAAGLGVTALVWQVLARPTRSISDYFLQTSLPLGGGSNAVNVIIVDYRGFDTLGEITVLVIAALIMHTLLAGFAPPAAARAPQPVGTRPLMLQVVASLTLPFALLVTVHLFLRGHNLPGGGFIAGLVLAIALLLQSLAQGQAWAGARAGFDHRHWMGVGLLIATATGLASWWFGAPFLTSTYDYPWLAGVGGVPMASAAAFDLGVFAVVVGATLVMLLSLMRLSAVRT